MVGKLAQEKVSMEALAAEERPVTEREGAAARVVGT